MSEIRKFIEDSITSLKQQRDELAVQMDLGKKELRDEWEQLRVKLDRLSADYEPVREALGESAENLFTSLKLVAGELSEGFQRVRKAIGEANTSSKKD